MRFRNCFAGFRALRWKFWFFFPRNPIQNTELLILLIGTALRDLFMWVTNTPPPPD